MNIKYRSPKLPKKDREVLGEMGNDLKQVLIRPFLILFKIPANLLEVMYQGVCLYSVKIPQCIGRLAMLPVNLLISLCEGLSFGQVQARFAKTRFRLGEHAANRSRSLGNWFSRRHSAGRKLKIYQKTVSRYCIADDSTARDYVREKCCYGFAFLLQAVSFFTTYAGLELYFGGVFFLAPFFITLVIQGTLYTAVVTVFQSRKRKLPMIICMGVFACASIVFSYTGLITLYSSPARDYTQAYETYAQRFGQTKAALLDGYTDKSQAATNILKATDIMTTNVSMARQRIDVLTAQRDAIKIPPRFTSSRSLSLGPDGSRTTTTVPVANGEYQASVDSMNQLNADIAGLEQGCRIVEPFLQTYDSDAIRSLFMEEASNDASVSENEPESTHPSLNQLETDFSQAALTNNGLAQELGNDFTVDSELVTSSIKSMKGYGNLASISLNLPADSPVLSANSPVLPADGPALSANSPALPVNSPALPAQNPGTFQADKPSGLMAFILKAGQFLGADFGNADMNSLTRMREDVRTAVNDNYSEMLAYKDKGTDFAPLSAAQAQADALPGIMVFGAKRLLSPQTRSDAALCLCLALFNDCTSILLGYAGTVKRGQVTLNSRGKHRINGISDLFITLYYSMHEAFAMQIKCGRFDDMEDHEFEGLCRKFVNTASSRINCFIGKFTLSACTSSQGYNRCLVYRDQEDVKNFMPFISALIQAGLLEIIPLTAYVEIQDDFNRGILWSGNMETKGSRPAHDSGKNKSDAGYVLLLKNSGEEYMLKQLGYDFVMDSV